MEPLKCSERFTFLPGLAEVCLPISTSGTTPSEQSSGIKTAPSSGSLETTRVLKITLPFPNADLNPNRAHGRHWGALAKLKKDARLQAYLETMKVLNGKKHAFLETRKVLNGKKHAFSGLISLTLTFFMADHRKRDADNLLGASKPSIDGVAEGLGINDRDFEPVTIKRVYGAEKSMLFLEIGE